MEAKRILIDERVAALNQALGNIAERNKTAVNVDRDAVEVFERNISAVPCHRYKTLPM